jgi:hypothetical protein
MKKVFSIILLAAVVTSLVACDSSVDEKAKMEAETQRKIDSVRIADSISAVQTALTDSLAAVKDLEQVDQNNNVLSEEKLASWETTLMTFRKYFKNKQKNELLAMGITGELVCLYCINDDAADYIQFIDHLFSNNELYLKYEKIINKKFKYSKTEYAEFFCSGECDLGDVSFVYNNQTNKWLFKGIVENGD